MLVKDLIALLQTVKEDMQVGKRDGGGFFVPLEETDVGLLQVMKFKNDNTVAVSAADPLWKNKLKEFEEPFSIVLID